jgi:hypothetical protein
VSSFTHNTRAVRTHVCVGLDLRAADEAWLVRAASALLRSFMPETLMLAQTGQGYRVIGFLGAGDVELVDSIHAQNAPPHRAELRDESAKSKGKVPNCTIHSVWTNCTGAADNPFELREHPGYRLRSPGPAKFRQNPWRRRRTLPEGV